MRFILHFCLSCFRLSKIHPQGVREDAANGRGVIGATVVSHQQWSRYQRYGFYSITLDAVQYEANYSYVICCAGQNHKPDCQHAAEFSMELAGRMRNCKVVVSEIEQTNTHKTWEDEAQTNMISELFLKVPFLGETDVLQSIQLLPMNFRWWSARALILRSGNVVEFGLLGDSGWFLRTCWILLVSILMRWKMWSCTRYGENLLRWMWKRERGNSKSLKPQALLAPMFSRLAIESPSWKISIICGSETKLHYWHTRPFKVFDDGATRRYTTSAQNQYSIDKKSDWDLSRRLFRSRDKFLFDAKRRFSWGNAEFVLMEPLVWWQMLQQYAVPWQIRLQKFSLAVAIWINSFGIRIQNFIAKPGFTWFCEQQSWSYLWLSWWLRSSSNAVGVSEVATLRTSTPKL